MDELYTMARPRQMPFYWDAQIPLKVAAFSHTNPCNFATTAASNEV